MRVDITAETGAGSTPEAPSLTIWTSSCPTSIGWARVSNSSRRPELSQSVAACLLPKLCRITQSTWAGGLGGSTLWRMKPGNPTAAWPIFCCHAARLLGLHSCLGDDRDRVGIDGNRSRHVEP